MSTTLNLALIPGDGIGTEVVAEAVKVLKAVAPAAGISVQTREYDLGARRYNATGELLPITWDFSHLSVVKHLAPPYWERLLVDPRLIQHSEQFHFRPFNGHHCQIPVTDGRGNLGVELKQWLPFLDKTLGMWLAGNQDGRELFAVPELGPVRGGYNLASLPNSWEDAKVLRTLIAKAWTKALSTHKK